MKKRADIKTGFVCNNNCRFCVQADNKNKGNRCLEEIKRDLVECRERCDGLVLTGGEVTIRKDFLDIVRFAKNLDYKVIQIQTNGRMFSSLEFCRKTIQAGATEISPAIHGYCKEQHEYLTRAEGSFYQTIKGIRNLKSIGAYVLTNTVVVKSNYSSIPEIAKLLVKLDVDQFQFAFVHPVGNAWKNYDNIVPAMSLSVPYIKKGLNWGKQFGKKVMVEAVPYCLMDGFEDCIAEEIMPETEIKATQQQTTLSYAKTRRASKKKFPQCKDCKYLAGCEGPWAEYPLKKGNKEFHPIKEVKPDTLQNYNSEILPVIQGLKPVSVLEVHKADLEDYRISLEKLDLTYEIISHQEFNIRRRQLGKKPHDTLFPDSCFVYISKEEWLVKKALEFDLIDDNENLGKILGYPDCCISWFVENNEKERTKNKEPFLYICHYPCSKDCAATRTYEDQLRRIIENEKLQKSPDGHNDSLDLFHDSVI